MNEDNIFLQALECATHCGLNKPILIDCRQDPRGAFIQGQAFGCQGLPRTKNPYPIGTQAREWFDAGMSHETDELVGI